MLSHFYKSETNHDNYLYFFKSEKELILWNSIDLVQFDLINIKLF